MKVIIELRAYDSLMARPGLPVDWHRVLQDLQRQLNGAARVVQLRFEEDS